LACFDWQPLSTERYEKGNYEKKDQKASVLQSALGSFNSDLCFL